VVIILVGLYDNTPNREAFLKRIMFFWAVGATFSGAYAVFQQFTPALGNLPFLYRLLSSNRFVGLTNHPNHLGLATAISLPVLIYTASSARGLTRLVSVLAVPVSMYATFLSGSRAALVAGPAIFAVTCIYFLIATNRIPEWVPLAAPFMLLSAIVIIPKVIQGSRFADESAGASTVARITDIEQGRADILANPFFGVAIGAPAPTMVPMAILVYGGIFFFTVFYGSLIYSLIGPRIHERTFAAILLITAASVLCYGLLGNAWLDRYLYWPFAALFAININNRRLRTTEAGEIRSRGIAHPN
jgi:hypothetical protein